MKIQLITLLRMLHSLTVSAPWSRALSARLGPGRLRTAEEGAATAEYAVATLAAVGFAGLLVAILRSDAVREMLTGLVQTALSVVGQ